MATLTNNWQMLGQTYVGHYNFDLYVRVYALYTSQDIGNNRTYVKYQMRTYYAAKAGYTVYDNNGTCSVGGTGVNTSSGSCITARAGEVTFATAEGWVYHNASGEANISCTASINWPNWGWRKSASGSASLPTIPRKANITAANNFTDELNPSFTYSNPAGNSVSSLQACLGWTGNADIPYRDVSKSGGTYTFELTEEDRELIRKNITNANTRTITYYLKTVIGGTTHYSSVGKTCTIVNAEPQLEATARENSPKVKELTGNDNTLIRGFTDVAVKMTPKVFKHATIAETTISADSEVINGTEGAFRDIVSGLFTFTLKDSRGNIATKDIKFNVIDYIKTTCNFENITMNVAGEANLLVSGNFFNQSFGAVQNTLTLEYRYKGNNGVWSEWTPAEHTPSSNTYNANILITGLDYKQVYSFEVKATDKLTSATTPTRAAQALPVFDWGKDSFNFNVPVTFQGSPLCELVYPIGSIYMSVSPTSPEVLFGGTWERIQDRFLLGASNTYKENTEGGEATHTLSIDEMPIHAHGFKDGSHTFLWGQNRANNVYLTNASAVAGKTPGNNAMTSQNHWTYTNNAGGGKAHNNMPPYLSVFIWKRTA